MALKEGEVLSGGFVRDKNGALSVSAEGTNQSGGFLRDADGRVVMAGSPNWSSGTSLPIFTANAEGTYLDMSRGTEASPDATFGSPFKVSRTLSLAESAFTGDGGIGLGAITGINKALSSSQAQAIGLVGGATTASSYAGEHSNADAFGGGFYGRSLSGSTRVGGGIFATGQRNHNEGKATGAELSSENNAENAGSYNSSGYSNSMGLWIAPKGSQDSGAGAQIGHPGTAKFKVGFAVNASAVTDAAFRDDSSAERSVLIGGTHSKAAVAVKSGSGSIVVGAEEPTVANALLDIYFGESALTPGVVLGTDKAKNISVRFRNSTGELNAFAANTANNFLTGTAQGDTGFNFTAGKVFHVGAIGKSSFLRINETGIAFNGATPVAKASAIGSPAAEAAALKTAVDAIRAALTNVGITA